MDAALHRHDISDRSWEIIAPHLPGKNGDWGGVAEDNRRFINAVVWILRTGAPWRDLPPEFGGWKNAHRRFCRWRDKGIWERLLAVVIDEPDFEWLMIDGTHIKAHKHACGAKGGSEAIGRTKGGRAQDSSGRGCAWNVNQSNCHSGYRGGYYNCSRVDGWHRSGRASCRAMGTTARNLWMPWRRTALRL